jgi:hypothetical protein
VASAGSFEAKQTVAAVSALKMEVTYSSEMKLDL